MMFYKKQMYINIIYNMQRIQSLTAVARGTIRQIKTWKKGSQSHHLKLPYVNDDSETHPNTQNDPIYCIHKL